MAGRYSTLLLGTLAIMSQVSISQAAAFGTHSSSATYSPKSSSSSHTSSSSSYHISSTAQSTGKASSTSKASSTFANDQVLAEDDSRHTSSRSSRGSSASSSAASAAQDSAVASAVNSIGSLLTGLGSKTATTSAASSATLSSTSSASSATASGNTSIDGLKTSVTVGSDSIHIGNFSLGQITPQVTTALQQVCNNAGTSCDGGSPFTLDMDWVAGGYLEPANVQFDIISSSYDTPEVLDAMITLAANAYSATAQTGGNCQTQHYWHCPPPSKLKKRIDAPPPVSCDTIPSITTCNMVNYIEVQLFNYSSATQPPPSAWLEVNATFTGQLPPGDMECSGIIGSIGSLLALVAPEVAGVLGAISAICSLTGR